MLTRLVTGCSWVTAERLLGGQVSDTTMLARRDEWIEVGVFEDLEAEAAEAYDHRIVGLDLTEAWEPMRLTVDSRWEILAESGRSISQELPPGSGDFLWQFNSTQHYTVTGFVPASEPGRGGMLDIDVLLDREWDGKMGLALRRWHDTGVQTARHYRRPRRGMRLRADRQRCPGAVDVRVHQPALNATARP